MEVASAFSTYCSLSCPMMSAAATGTGAVIPRSSSFLQVRTPQSISQKQNLCLNFNSRSLPTAPRAVVSSNSSEPKPLNFVLFGKQEVATIEVVLEDLDGYTWLCLQHIHDQLCSQVKQNPEIKATDVMLPLLHYILVYSFDWVRSDARIIHSGWDPDRLVTESQRLGEAARKEYHWSWKWWKNLMTRRQAYSRIYLRILASFDKDVDQDSVRGRYGDHGDLVFNDRLELMILKTTVTSDKDACLYGAYGFHMNYIQPKLLIYASTDSNFDKRPDSFTFVVNPSDELSTEQLHSPLPLMKRIMTKIGF